MKDIINKILKIISKVVLGVVLLFLLNIFI